MDELKQAVESAVGEGAPRSELAYAKINLALHVIGKRPDGFHLIDSLVVFADYADVVTVLPSPDGRMRLTVKGPFAAKLGSGTQPNDNLAIRAASELMRAVDPKRGPRPIKLVLTKRIPVAAGLGGGSADAAAALRVLRKEWGLKLDDDEMTQIGLRLGADVPMCLLSRPLVARGIGERISLIQKMPAMPVVIAHPGVAVETAKVFAKLEPRERSAMPPMPERFATLLEVIFWLRQARNDLVEPAVKVNRSAGAAAKALMSDPDCLFARMSGSGASAFGIFVTLDAAERAAQRLREAKPNWFVAAAMTRAS